MRRTTETGRNTKCTVCRDKINVTAKACATRKAANGKETKAIKERRGQYWNEEKSAFGA